MLNYANYCLPLNAYVLECAQTIMKIIYAFFAFLVALSTVLSFINHDPINSVILTDGTVIIFLSALPILLSKLVAKHYPKQKPVTIFLLCLVISFILYIAFGGIYDHMASKHGSVTNWVHQDVTIDDSGTVHSTERAQIDYKKNPLRTSGVTDIIGTRVVFFINYQKDPGLSLFVSDKNPASSGNVFGPKSQANQSSLKIGTAKDLTTNEALSTNKYTETEDLSLISANQKYPTGTHDYVLNYSVSGLEYKASGKTLIDWEVAGAGRKPTNKATATFQTSGKRHIANLWCYTNTDDVHRPANCNVIKSGNTYSIESVESMPSFENTYVIIELSD